MAALASTRVVQIKAATDKPLLLALVQSLMYAAELGSEHQRLRLATHGADSRVELRSRLSFLEHASSPFMDLILLIEAGSSHAQDAEAVAGLAQRLFAGDQQETSSLRQHVRSIMAVEGVVRGDELLCRRLWRVR